MLSSSPAPVCSHRTWSSAGLQLATCVVVPRLLDLAGIGFDSGGSVALGQASSFPAFLGGSSHQYLPTALYLLADLTPSFEVGVKQENNGSLSNASGKSNVGGGGGGVEELIA